MPMTRDRRAIVKDAPPVTDTEFARAFERGEVPDEDFHHRDHLRIARVYLRECGSLDVAAAKMGALLRAFAARAGKAEKYHETLTLFWMHLLASVDGGPELAGDIEPVLARHPYMLDKKTPLAYYSPALLFSDEARARWVPPDLRRLGSHATGIDSCDP